MDKDNYDDVLILTMDQALPDQAPLSAADTAHAIADHVASQSVSRLAAAKAMLLYGLIGSRGKTHQASTRPSGRF